MAEQAHERAIDTFRRAARFNDEDPFRKGSMLELPGYGQAVMTGDLHGNRENFQKLTRYAMLDRAAGRHVVLHEMVHSEAFDPTHPMGGLDRSHELLLEAAEYKCAFPEQVHFLQSNHELAQLTDYPIAKNGRAVVDHFNASVRQEYGAAYAGPILAAMNEFIASFPLAIRTPNRVWLSHSLPNVRDMDRFDPSIFNRALTREDLWEDRGTVFNMVWGRHHTEEHIQRLITLLDVDMFILGHQPQEMGHAVCFNRVIILASDHSHGVFLPFDLGKPQSVDRLVAGIRKFVEIE